MGDFLDEGDKGGDVALVEGATRVVGLEFGDDGACIENGQVKRIVRLAQKRASAAEEMGSVPAGPAIERGATAFANETSFKINRNGRVGPFEQELDFAQEGHGTR